MPLIEAMQRGIPIAASDLPVIREIAGNASFLFDPRDPAAIANALTQIASDPLRRSQLVERGRQRLREYDDDREAAKLSLVFSELARNPSRGLVGVH